MNPSEREAARKLAGEAKERADRATEGPWYASRAVEYDPKNTNPFHDEGASVSNDGPIKEPYDARTYVVMGGKQDEQGGAVGVLKNADADFVAQARGDVPDLSDALLSALSWGEETERENERLREALEFYGEDRSWRKRLFTSARHACVTSAVLMDGGDRARAALSPERKEAPS